MIQLKRFLDKMAVMESRQSKDIVLPMSDARGLRDDIAKLLADLHELGSKRIEKNENEVMQIEIKGGSFKNG